MSRQRGVRSFCRRRRHHQDRRYRRLSISERLCRPVLHLLLQGRKPIMVMVVMGEAGAGLRGRLHLGRAGCMTLRKSVQAAMVRLWHFRFFRPT